MYRYDPHGRTFIDETVIDCTHDVAQCRLTGCFVDCHGRALVSNCKERILKHFDHDGRELLDVQVDDGFCRSGGIFVNSYFQALVIDLHSQPPSVRLYKLKNMERTLSTSVIKEENRVVRPSSGPKQAYPIAGPSSEPKQVHPVMRPSSESNQAPAMPKDPRTPLKPPIPSFKIPVKPVMHPGLSTPLRSLSDLKIETEDHLDLINGDDQSHFKAKSNIFSFLRNKKH